MYSLREKWKMSAFHSKVIQLVIDIWLLCFLGPASFKISVWCRNQEGNVVSTDTLVTVNFHHKEKDAQLATNQIVPDKTMVEQICFSHISENSSLAVEENVKGVVIGRLNTCWVDRKYERKYKIEKRKCKILDISLSALKLWHSSSFKEPMHYL